MSPSWLLTSLWENSRLPLPKPNISIYANNSHPINNLLFFMHFTSFLWLLCTDTHAHTSARMCTHTRMHTLSYVQLPSILLCLGIWSTAPCPSLLHISKGCFHSPVSLNLFKLLAGFSTWRLPEISMCGTRTREAAVQEAHRPAFQSCLWLSLGKGIYPPSLSPQLQHRTLRTTHTGAGKITRHQALRCFVHSGLLTGKPGLPPLPFPGA